MSSQHSTHEAFDAVAQALTVGEAAYLKSGLGQDFSVFNKAHAMLAGIEEQLEALREAARPFAEPDDTTLTQYEVLRAVLYPAPERQDA